MILLTPVSPTRYKLTEVRVNNKPNMYTHLLYIYSMN